MAIKKLTVIRIKDTVIKANSIMAYHETKTGSNTFIYIYFGNSILKFDFLATDQIQLEEVRKQLKEVFQ